MLLINTALTAFFSFFFRIDIFDARNRVDVSQVLNIYEASRCSWHSFLAFLRLWHSLDKNQCGWSLVEKKKTKNKVDIYGMSGNRYNAARGQTERIILAFERKLSPEPGKQKGEH